MRDEEEEESDSPAGHRARASTSRDEFDFINRIRRLAHRHAKKLRRFSSSLIPHPSSLGFPPSSLRQGIGDDAALVRQFDGYETVITADLLVEDIDFRRSSTRARLLGHKALAVSLSDIAAMGARPYWSFLSFGMPRDAWKDSFRNEFISG